jgi:uroporphyrinogen-III synthase
VSKRIFISKNASEITSLRSQFEAKGYEVIAHSFLSFSAVEFEIQHPYDVIFFGSPRAVVFFKASESISPDKLIACVGSKTAEVLEAMGHRVDFVGQNSSEPKTVAEDFKNWLASTDSYRFRQAQCNATPLSQRASKAQSEERGARVLFPLSSRSLKTIAGAIPEDQKEEVVVYQTEVKGKMIPPCDVYAFSSPSNVEGFFEVNEIREGAEVVAWGTSTERALKEYAEKMGFEVTVGIEGV